MRILLTNDDGIGTRYVFLDGRKIRCYAAKSALTKGSPRDVRIEQYDVIVAANLETRRSKPANLNAGISFSNECVAIEFQVF